MRIAEVLVAEARYLPVGAEGYSRNTARLISKSLHQLVTLQVPQLYRFIQLLMKRASALLDRKQS